MYGTYGGMQEVKDNLMEVTSDIFRHKVGEERLLGGVCIGWQEVCCGIRLDRLWSDEQVGLLW